MAEQLTPAPISDAVNQQLAVELLSYCFSYPGSYLERLEVDVRALDSKAVGFATLLSIVAAMIAWSVSFSDLANIPKAFYALSLFSVLAGIVFCFVSLRSAEVTSGPTPHELADYSLDIVRSHLMDKGADIDVLYRNLNDLNALFARASDNLWNLANKKTKWLKWLERSSLFAAVMFTVGVLTSLFW